MVRYTIRVTQHSLPGCYTLRPMCSPPRCPVPPPTCRVSKTLHQVTRHRLQRSGVACSLGNGNEDPPFFSVVQGEDPQSSGREEGMASPTEVEVLGDLEQQQEQQQQQQQPQSLTFNDRIGFIGAGQMGEALIRGFIRAGMCVPSRVCVSVRSEERRLALVDLGLQVFGDAIHGGAAEVAAASDIIFLGVKPQLMDGVLEALRPHVTRNHLIISIAAGVRLASLEANLPEGTRVVRVMPNTPCLIGQAASAYVLGNNATGQDAAKTYTLMSSAGLAVNVEERMMDAVTGLSGSGPAYVFLAIEAMSDGAVAAGLPRDKALALAAQTVAGAARMVFEASGDGSLVHPALLRDQVTSPAGTTIAGLAELETSGVRGALIRAVKAAAKRSEDLG